MLFNAHVVSWLHTLAVAMIPYGIRKSDGEWSRSHGMRRTFVTPADMRMAWKEGRWYAPPDVKLTGDQEWAAMKFHHVVRMGGR